MKQLLTIHLLAFLLTFWGACKEAYFEPVLEGTLQGDIVHAITSEPIANAEIKLTPAVGSVLTDETGRFFLENLEVGKYTVEIKKSGFDTELTTVEILSAQTSTLSLLLQPDLQINHAPASPFNPVPAHQSREQTTNVWLKWEASDPDAEDELVYTVYLFAEGQSSNIPLLNNSPETEVEVKDLSYNTTYLWQVVVDDGTAEKVNGPIWSFTTESFPDYRFSWVRQVAGKSQVFAADDNGNEFQLSTEEAHFWRPRRSPNRQQIACISNRELSPQLFVMDKDGHNLQQLTTLSITGGNDTEMNYCWVSDGARLLYTHQNLLLSINKDGSGLEMLATAPEGKIFSSVDWTPFGSKMVLSAIAANTYDSEIYLLHLNGSLEKLVDNKPGKTGSPVFSIDGKNILYSHDISGFENTNGRQLDSHIFLMDISSGMTTDLSFDKTPGTNDLDPRFSPNGAQVIFTNKQNDDQSPGDIYRMDLQGLNRQLLFENAEMPDWR